MSRERRKQAVNSQISRLSITRQCELLGISRASFYYKNRRESDYNLHLMRLIDKQYMQTPYYGSRQMVRHLKRYGYKVNRKRIRRLMSQMGIFPVYPRPKTSKPGKDHRIYPYLLRGLEINSPNQVWCADISYIPLKKGFMYMVAIMDWRTRKILSWRLSNTMDINFCIEALEEALYRYGKPDIFNTDQGSQFTSKEFTGLLKEQGIKISMDGKGRWTDNIFIERFWRSFKYECVYLQEFEDGKNMRQSIARWINHYNQDRPHSSLDDKTPNDLYFANLEKAA